MYFLILIIDIQVNLTYLLRTNFYCEFFEVWFICIYSYYICIHLLYFVFFLLLALTHFSLFCATRDSLIADHWCVCKIKLIALLRLLWLFCRMEVWDTNNLYYIREFIIYINVKKKVKTAYDIKCTKSDQ